MFSFEHRFKPTFRRRTARAAFTIAALTMGAGSLGMAPSAYAAEPNYEHVVAGFQHSQTGSYAGGYISCPSGTKAVATGATVGPNGYLMAGTTTYDGNGGYHTAWGWNSSALNLSARCVAPARLAGAQLATMTLRSHQQGFRTYGREVPCPTGTVPYGGGAFTSNQGAVTGGLITIGSVPGVTSDGRPAWKYTGVGDLGNGELAMSTHCLPRQKLGRVVTVTETTPAPVGYKTVFAAARCPAGFFAFSGGAWWSTTAAPATPAWVGYLTSSDITADERGWMALGYGFNPNAQLTTTVRCTTRLG